MDREGIRRYFDDVCGYEEVKKDLIYLCDVMLNPEAYSKLGAKLPRNVMLCGEPGVGKTLLAECMIKASGRPVYRCRKADGEVDFIPQINAVFSAARRNAPSVVFLDDMDKFAGLFYDEAPEFAAVQACIDDASGEDVFVIATINDREDLTDSLVRPGRFDRYITVDMPDAASTLKIIERYFSGMKNLSPDIDFRELAELAAGMTAVEIRTLANEAGVYAAYERSGVITMRHIVRAFVDRNDNKRRTSDNSGVMDRKIACHEAGHAVIAELLDRGSATLVFAGEEQSESSGLMSLRRMEKKYTPGACRRSAFVALGGRAATEIVFGRPDQGASADLRCAYDSIRKEVSELCIYGLEYADHHSNSDESPKRRDMRERKIREVLSAYYSEVLDMLRDNRDFLDSMTEMLMTKGYLFQKDISQIRQSTVCASGGEIVPAQARSDKATEQGERYAYRNEQNDKERRAGNNPPRI